MKKIALLTHSLSRGGTERFVSILLNALYEQYEFHLILLDNVVEYEIPESVTCHILRGGIGKYSVTKILEIPRLAKKYGQLCEALKIDISYALLERPNFINILSVKYGNEALIYCGERCTPSQVYQGKGMKSLVFNFLIKKLYNRADLILSNSEGIKQDLVAHYAIDPAKIQTIYNPVNIAKLRASGNTVRQAETFTFVNVANLSVYKNHMVLLKAFHKIKHKNTVLRIVGEGVMRESLTKFIKENNLENQVFLMGYQKQPEIWLKQSDCFVLSSDTEGFPNVVLEAMAVGLPVIATDCKSGPREILSPDNKMEAGFCNGVTLADFGILVPTNNADLLADAMLQMMEDNSLRKQYKIKSSERVQAFETASIMEHFKKIFVGA